MLEIGAPQRAAVGREDGQVALIRGDGRHLRAHGKRKPGAPCGSSRFGRRTRHPGSPYLHVYGPKERPEPRRLNINMAWYGKKSFP